MPGTVPTGVGSVIISPPLALLRPILDEHGPFTTGDYTITDFLTTTSHGLLPAGTWPIGGTYGVVLQVNGAIPITWGYDIGYDSGGALGAEGWVYHERFCQLVVMHEAIGGAFLTVGITELHEIQRYVPLSWIPVGGDRLGLHVEPGVAVDLFFMCLLA